MVPRPASPTALLWAHELKRQHEFLLKRQKDLETKNESVQTAVADIKTHAQTIQDHALDSAQLSAAVATTKEQASQIESLTRRLIALEKDKTKLDEDMDKAFTREKSMLKRLIDLDTVQKEVKDNLTGLKHDLKESDTAGLEAKILGMEATSRRHESQLRDLIKVVNEDRSSHENLATSTLQLDGKIRALEEQAAKFQPDAPRSFTVWMDVSETQHGGERQRRESSEEEQLSRETTLNALEPLSRQQQRKESEGTRAPKLTRQVLCTRNRDPSTSPLERKQKSFSRQKVDRNKRQNYKKCPPRNAQTEHTQLRRSQRITRQPVRYHDLEKNPAHQANEHSRTIVNSARAKRANATHPEQVLLGKQGSRFSNPRPILGENRTAANRGVSASSTLSELSTPSCPSQFDSKQYAQRQACTMRPAQSDFPAPGVFEDPPHTPVRFQGIQTRSEHDIQSPEMSPNLQAAMPEPSIEESPPWRVPKFMLPDFSVPPDWYRPNG
ncbi:MAG: hypothetical protein M1821_008596 [Bathelium mastoideum]|nr:MAG: hypothetical protein M1821_008596 [Bathelium mastoideum]